MSLFYDKNGNVIHICFNCLHLDCGLLSECWFCSKDGHHIKNTYILFHGKTCKNFDKCEDTPDD